MEKLLLVAVISVEMVFTRRFLEKIFLLDEKSVLLVVIRFFIKINLPLERIVSSTFRKKLKTKTVFFFLNR